MKIHTPYVKRKTKAHTVSGTDDDDESEKGVEMNLTLLFRRVSRPD